MLDAERRIGARRIKVQFFDVIDAAKARSRRKIMFKSFDLCRRTFDKSLPRPSKILHVANNLVPCRRALREEAIAHALHIAANQKASGDLARICRDINCIRNSESVFTIMQIDRDSLAECEVRTPPAC